MYAFVTCVMETYIDIHDAVTTVTNYKDIFQKYCQREYGTTPTYKMLDPYDDGRIRVCIVLNGNTLNERGEGTTRKKAEQMAARNALITYGVA